MDRCVWPSLPLTTLMMGSKASKGSLSTLVLMTVPSTVLVRML